MMLLALLLAAAPADTAMGAGRAIRSTASAAARYPLAGQARDDWANLCRYRAENAALSVPARIVFMGDSITELWQAADPDLFKHGVVDRGISAQTTPQMPLRFPPDVLALRPRAVHLLAGTNDVASNTGPTTEQACKNNIVAITTLARAHGIKVVIGAIPPAGAFWWAPRMTPAAQIVRLNVWLADHARRNGFAFIDYHLALATPGDALRADFANDGVHPNRAGYAAMRAQARTALRPYLPKGDVR